MHSYIIRTAIFRIGIQRTTLRRVDPRLAQVCEEAVDLSFPLEKFTNIARMIASLPMISYEVMRSYAKYVVRQGQSSICVASNGGCREMSRNGSLVSVFNAARPVACGGNREWEFDPGSGIGEPHFGESGFGKGMKIQGIRIPEFSKISRPNPIVHPLYPCDPCARN